MYIRLEVLGQFSSWSSGPNWKAHSFYDIYSENSPNYSLNLTLII